jgi:hypothetical protein
MKKNVFLVAALLALMATVLSAQTDDSGGTPGLKFTLPKGGKGYTVDKGKVKTGAVVIPESYNNLPVTAIAKKAFSSSTITGITIPTSITDIGDQAFKGCKNLTEIIIPDSVTSIGKEAFENCTSLIGITIPNGVTSIESGTFDGCTSLTSVIIGNGVISIKSGALEFGGGAFYKCTSLTSITLPDSVISIGYGTFQKCTSLTSVTIGNGVTSIGRQVFKDCTSLTAINVDANNTTYSSDNGVLYNKNKTFLIQCPEGKLSVTIPDSVTGIGDFAFSSCKGINDITIPNRVTSIGKFAFSDCTGLTSVTIGNSVIYIGEYAFGNCGRLASVTFLGDFNGGMFGGFSKDAFQGDLREKYTNFIGAIPGKNIYIGNLDAGPGTYTRPVSGNGLLNTPIWTKQNDEIILGL